MPMFKKYGTYAYFIPGLVSVGAVAFNMLPKYSGVTQKLATGFIYDLPRQTMNLVNALSAKTTQTAGVQAAQRIAAAASHAKPAWRPKGIMA